MLEYNQCTEEELKYTYPADKYAEEGAMFIYRAISIKTGPAEVFPWISQLRFAPYSYDWIDNYGRKSPPYLLTDAPPLKTGDPIMRWFTLVEFRPNESITLTLPQNPPLYLKLLFEPFIKSFYTTYQLFPLSDNTTRLVVKTVINPYHDSLRRRLVKIADALDYVMMRRQLLNFKQLAEN